MFSADGRVVTANSSAEELFEAPFSWMEGRSHEAMVTALEAAGGGVYEEDGEPFPMDRHPVTLSRDVGVAASDVVMGIALGAERQVRWFQVSSRPLLTGASGPPYAVVVSFTDISETKSAELERGRLVELLDNQRESLTAILASIDEGIVACDSTGHVTLCNQAMRLYLQLRPGQEPYDAPRRSTPSTALTGARCDRASTRCSLLSPAPGCRTWRSSSNRSKAVDAWSSPTVVRCGPTTARPSEPSSPSTT